MNAFQKIAHGIVCLLFFAGPGHALAQAVTNQPLSTKVGAVSLTNGEPSSQAPAIPELQLVSERRLSERLVELVFRTPMLASLTKVQVLLPKGYDTHPTTRYSSIYLLHGCCNQGQGNPAYNNNWTSAMNAEAATVDYPVIVVMPDGGNGGFYSDWYNNGNGGSPMWETFHIRQLLPWVDRHYRTIPKRSNRAVAGLSMGGFGALSYAARHPDLFVAAASYSGAVDNMDGSLPATPYFPEAFAALDGGVPGSIWGLKAAEELRWRAHNPIDLAGNLRGIALVLMTGNGLPGGPYSPELTDVDPLEAYVWLASTRMHQRLQALGIDHIWDDYGAGAHRPAYWERDLKLTLPVFMQVFSQSRPYPSAFSYTTMDPGYRRFGWDVAIQRHAHEFSTLEANGKLGFRLTGSGTAVVTTAASYSPGKAYEIVTMGPHQHSTARVLAGADRRLRIPVNMGPANAFQEYSVLAKLSGSPKYTVTVAIAPAP